MSNTCKRRLLLKRGYYSGLQRRIVLLIIEYVDRACLENGRCILLRKSKPKRKRNVGSQHKIETRVDSVCVVHLCVAKPIKHT